MDKIRIQVIYNGNFFEFNEGLKRRLVRNIYYGI